MPRRARRGWNPASKDSQSPEKFQDPVIQPLWQPESRSGNNRGVVLSSLRWCKNAHLSILKGQIKQ